MSEKIKTINQGDKQLETFVPEVEELRAPMAKIIAEIRPEIERGSYGLVVGIDASGRVPALIVVKVIQNIYKRIGAHIDIKFIAGTRGGSNGSDTYYDKDVGTREYIQTWNIDKSKKILLVDDTISGGDSLKPLCDILREFGYVFDVVAVGHLEGYSERNAEGIQQYLGADRLIVGEKGVPRIYGNSDISGVRKDSRKLFSEKHVDGRPDTLSASRSQAKEMADDLANSNINEK